MHNRRNCKVVFSFVLSPVRSLPFSLFHSFNHIKYIFILVCSVKKECFTHRAHAGARIRQAIFAHSNSHISAWFAHISFEILSQNRKFRWCYSNVITHYDKSRVSLCNKTESQTSDPNKYLLHRHTFVYVFNQEPWIPQNSTQFQFALSRSNFTIAPLPVYTYETAILIGIFLAHYTWSTRCSTQTHMVHRPNSQFHHAIRINSVSFAAHTSWKTPNLFISLR